MGAHRESQYFPGSAQTFIGPEKEVGGAMGCLGWRLVGKREGRVGGEGLLPQDESHRERRVVSWSQREGLWAGLVL